ncbi:MAG TPA: DUF502 domain-containing protein, partial [Bacteroidetes bacterium]|nr:DUF502 domain-containing protein [Bacteroidota bacterium]
SIAGVLAIGILAHTVILRPVFYSFEELFTRAPIIKFVYSSIKDLMEAFVGEKKRFTKPVLMNLIEETHLQRFGFITEESLTRIGSEFEGKVAVYVPMSYSLSGNLFIVPADKLILLPKVDSAELMKFIVSGGVTELDEVLKNNLPPDTSE